MTYSPLFGFPLLRRANPADHVHRNIECARTEIAILRKRRIFELRCEAYSAVLRRALIAKKGSRYIRTFIDVQTYVYTHTCIYHTYIHILTCI